MNEVYFNDKLLDIPSDEVIALNKQVNDIGELSLRKSDFAKTFKVKRTREMEALFENSGLISSQTEVPYTENRCTYLSGGLEQIVNGKLSIIKSDDDYYHVSIYSGAKNIFDEIGKLTLNDLDLSDLDHNWTFQNAADSVRNNLDYQYLLFDPSDDGGLIDDTPYSPEGIIFLAEYARPFLKLKRIWDQIWIDQGITCASDIDDNTLFLKMFQSIASLKILPDATSNFLTSHALVATTFVHNVRTLNVFTPIYDPSGTGAYRAKISGTHRFTYTAPRFFDEWILDCTINGVQQDITFTSSTDGLTWYFDFSLDLQAHDVVVFYSKWVFGTGSFDLLAGGITLTCYAIDSPMIGYSSAVNMATILDPMKQSDFVKAVCNFFSLIPSYDPLTNTINFWSLNKILKNRVVAKDWSNYLSVDEGELTYTIKNYVQKNLLKWKENEDVSSGAGDGYIICNNKTLEKEKDLIKLPIAFSDEIVHKAESMARIAWYKSVIGSADYEPLDTIATRWVTREDMAIALAYQHDIYQEVLTISEAKRASVLSLPFGNNMVNFAAVQNMITSPKVLTAKFNLPAKEVQAIDHSIPIFLEQHASYFYLNNVKNWIDGYLCECELIKL